MPTSPDPDGTPGTFYHLPRNVAVVRLLAQSVDHALDQVRAGVAGRYRVRVPVAAGVLQLPSGGWAVDYFGAVRPGPRGDPAENERRVRSDLQVALCRATAGPHVHGAIELQFEGSGGFVAAEPECYLLVKCRCSD